MLPKFISLLTTSRTTTGSINPTSTNAVPVATSTVVSNEAVGIGLGSGIAQEYLW